MATLESKVNIEIVPREGETEEMVQKRILETKNRLKWDGTNAYLMFKTFDEIMDYKNREHKYIDEFKAKGLKIDDNFMFIRSMTPIIISLEELLCSVRVSAGEYDYAVETKILEPNNMKIIAYYFKCGNIDMVTHLCNKSDMDILAKWRDPENGATLLHYLCWSNKTYHPILSKPWFIQGILPKFAQAKFDFSATAKVKYGSQTLLDCVIWHQEIGLIRPLVDLGCKFNYNTYSYPTIMPHDITVTEVKTKIDKLRASFDKEPDAEARKKLDTEIKKYLHISECERDRLITVDFVLGMLVTNLTATKDCETCLNCVNQRDLTYKTLEEAIKCGYEPIHSEILFHINRLLGDGSSPWLAKFTALLS